MIFNDRDVSSNSSSIKQAKKRKKRGKEQVEDEQPEPTKHSEDKGLSRQCYANPIMQTLTK